jgi:hypothetical protein
VYNSPACFQAVQILRTPFRTRRIVVAKISTNTIAAGVFYSAFTGDRDRQTSSPALSFFFFFFF